MLGKKIKDKMNTCWGGSMEKAEGCEKAPKLQKSKEEKALLLKSVVKKLKL